MTFRRPQQEAACRTLVNFLLADVQGGVAMASTLAGNFTLVGAAANLIVGQRARSGGVAIEFWPCFKVGAPLTVLTILFGVWWL